MDAGRSPMTLRPDPFAELGLTAAPDLTDDQVRAAWRATAAATLPGRPGGSRARYEAASAAYAVLRTAGRRAEAYAYLTAAPVPRLIRMISPVPAALRPPRVSPWRKALVLLGRIRHGRPGRLALRVLAAAVLAAALVAFLVTHPGAPAPIIAVGAGLLVGIASWLTLSARDDLAPLAAGDPDAPGDP